MPKYDTLVILLCKTRIFGSLKFAKLLFAAAFVQSN
jgi:hypothetical protein